MVAPQVLLSGQRLQVGIVVGLYVHCPTKGTHRFMISTDNSWDFHQVVFNQVVDINYSIDNTIIDNR